MSYMEALSGNIHSAFPLHSRPSGAQYRAVKKNAPTPEIRTF